MSDSASPWRLGERSSSSFRQDTAMSHRGRKRGPTVFRAIAQLVVSRGFRERHSHEHNTPDEVGMACSGSGGRGRPVGMTRRLRADEIRWSLDEPESVSRRRAEEVTVAAAKSIICRTIAACTSYGTTTSGAAGSCGLHPSGHQTRMLGSDDWRRRRCAAVPGHRTHRQPGRQKEGRWLGHHSGVQAPSRCAPVSRTGRAADRRCGDRVGR